MASLLFISTLAEFASAKLAQVNGFCLSHSNYTWKMLGTTLRGGSRYIIILSDVGRLRWRWTDFILTASSFIYLLLSTPQKSAVHCNNIPALLRNVFVKMHSCNARVVLLPIFHQCRHFNIDIVYNACVLGVLWIREDSVYGHANSIH